MKGSEILLRLNNGDRLIEEFPAYCVGRLYVTEAKAENRITRPQFEKYKKMCSKIDDDGKRRACLRGDGYNIYYSK